MHTLISMPFKSLIFQLITFLFFEPGPQAGRKRSREIFQMLPNFHGLPLEEPHQHLEKFHMVCDLVNLPQVTPEIIKMKLFPHTLRDKASHWLSTLDRELTSWKDIEQAFLRKFYPLGKIQNMRKHIWNFSQRPGETLHETWETFKDLLRKCPQHAIPKWQLNIIFYDGLLEQHRNMVDSICGGAFMEFMNCIMIMNLNLEMRFQKNQPSQTQHDTMEMMQQMSQMMQQTMSQMMQQTMNQMMLHQKQIIEALGNKREEGQPPKPSRPWTLHDDPPNAQDSGASPTHRHRDARILFSSFIEKISNEIYSLYENLSENSRDQASFELYHNFNGQFYDALIVLGRPFFHTSKMNTNVT
ncbi:unnamed protein product [Spirodela intermedia]|uniref:Retrotransposon gag domain-containing protein n=1 Tax=Spirodela intermedia TaxID=51605 RepID=A0ABN7ED92_SPIIN|nr:unnamed protein product [Spirodela intermedia]